MGDGYDREAPLKVMHLFEREDIVERCAELDTLLSTCSNQTPDSQCPLSTVAADGGEEEGNSSVSSSAKSLSYA
jgi:hypothetical protein